MGETRKIVIVGAGGLGREALATVRACQLVDNSWELLGFLDPRPELLGASIGGIPVLGGDDWCRTQNDDSIRLICAIGNSRIRRRVVESLSAMGGRFVTVVHPDVAIPATVRIGMGSLVMAGTRFTTDAQVGSHSVVYINCSITHDVRIGDYCVIAPGCNLAGACKLDTGVEMGVSASVLPGKHIGAWSIIGAGSVITRDIPPNVTAVGAPCRIVKEGPSD